MKSATRELAYRKKANYFRKETETNEKIRVNESDKLRT